MFSITDQLLHDRRARLGQQPKIHRSTDSPLADVVAVRLDSPLQRALHARATAEAVSPTTVLDRALRAYLEVA